MPKRRLISIAGCAAALVPLLTGTAHADDPGPTWAARRTAAHNSRADRTARHLAHAKAHDRAARLKLVKVTRLRQPDAAVLLRMDGVSWVSSGGCTVRTNPHCTSFDGLRPGSLDGVLALRDGSGCKITISGGTETGHAGGAYSHANGYKLDVLPTACVNGYITRTARRIATRGDGAIQYRSAGVTYARESSHWDITFG